MRPYAYTALVAVAVLSVLASYLFHSPQTPAVQAGLKYSDVVPVSS